VARASSSSLFPPITVSFSPMSFVGIIRVHPQSVRHFGPRSSGRQNLIRRVADRVLSVESRALHKFPTFLSLQVFRSREEHFEKLSFHTGRSYPGPSTWIITRKACYLTRLLPPLSPRLDRWGSNGLCWGPGGLRQGFGMVDA